MTGRFKFPLTARPATFGDNGDLVIKPSAASATSDYDFLQGLHTVRHKKLKQRLSGCNEWVEFDGTKYTEKILGGVGNIEKHHLESAGQASVEAMALRLFDRSAKLWSLYWADNISGTLDPPLRGSFEDDLGLFFGKDNFNGKEVLVQFQYDRSDRNEPVWGQAFSDDRGTTWEWNWFMFFKRM